MKRIILTVIAAALMVPVAATAAPATRVPTGYTKAQVKPAQIAWTGDGSIWFGGRTGHYSEPSRDDSPHTIPSLGHLQWTSYNTAHPSAQGVVWETYGGNSIQADRFRIEGTVEITTSDPVNGIDRKMLAVVHYNDRAGAGFSGKTVVVHFTAVGSDGFYSWQ